MDGDDGVAPRSRRSQTASWEDIQWRNVPSAERGGGGGRGKGSARSRGWIDSDDEDDEEDDGEDGIDLEEQRKGSARYSG